MKTPTNIQNEQTRREIREYKNSFVVITYTLKNGLEYPTKEIIRKPIKTECLK